ncbi:MAG: NosD domain-containing protein [Verrucomicrobiota bacterium]
MKRLLAAALFLAPLATSASAVASDLRARIAAAEAGATLQVEAGEHHGPFVIDQPLRLIGAPGAVLRGDGRDHVIAIRAADVEIAGFTIRGSGRELGDDHAAIHITGARAIIRDNRILDSLHGIYVRKADAARIERNVILGDGAGVAAVDDPLHVPLRPGESELCGVESMQDRRGNGIHLWNSARHQIADNVITGTRDGIYFSFTDETLVRGNTITRVRYGLHYMYSDLNTFERNRFSDNAAGSALMYSKGLVLRDNRFTANRGHRAYGLLLQSVDETLIEGNLIEGNTLGLFTENSNGLTVRANRIAGNHVGLRVSDSTEDSRFSENVFTGNIHAVESTTKGAKNTWSVGARGNVWDGAVALDLDRDGVSDLPHREPDVFGAWRRPFPAIGLLSSSPGAKLLHFIHSRLALPGMPGVTDPHPLLSSAKPSSP